MNPKPCPFCGSQIIRILANKEYPRRYLLECQGCKGRGPSMDSDEIAVDAWNGDLLDYRNEQRKKYFGQSGLEYPGDIEDDRRE